MMTYSDAKKELGNRVTKKLAHETILFRDGDDYVIRYWYTNIIRIRPSGKYSIYTGGFTTITTKRRIMKYVPIKLRQRKFKLEILCGNEWKLCPDSFVIQPKGMLK